LRTNPPRSAPMSRAGCRPASPGCRSRTPLAMPRSRYTTVRSGSNASRRRGPPSTPTTAACC
jgi:hypothetical protein